MRDYKEIWRGETGRILAEKDFNAVYKYNFKFEKPIVNGTKDLVYIPIKYEEKDLILQDILCEIAANIAKDKLL